jgi:hypothetical protein
MRNPLRTFRKRSRKLLSQKKRTRRLDLVGALIDLIKWRDNYMEALRNDKRIKDTRMVSLSRAAS